MEEFWLLIHLGFLAMAVVGIALADSSAMGWMRGRLETLEQKHIYRTHWIVTIGLCGLVYTGLYLFWPMRDYLLLQPYFLVKMAFVFALLVNSFFIESFMHIARLSPYSQLTPRQKAPLMLSGAVSTLCWL